MSEIIVLGLIPGTHIQITFVLWLLGVCGVATFLVVRFAHRKRLLRDFIIVSSILLLTRRTPASA